MKEKYFISKVLISLFVTASFNIYASCVSVFPDKKEVQFEVEHCSSLEEAMKTLVARCTKTAEEYNEKNFCEWVRKNPHEARFVYQLETIEETIKRCASIKKNSQNDFCNAVKEYPDEFQRASKQLPPITGVLLEGKVASQKAVAENKTPLFGRHIVYYNEKADCAELLGKKLLKIKTRSDCCDTTPGNQHCVLANGMYAETIGN